MDNRFEVLASPIVCKYYLAEPGAVDCTAGVIRDDGRPEACDHSPSSRSVLSQKLVNEGISVDHRYTQVGEQVADGRLPGGDSAGHAYDFRHITLRRCELVSVQCLKE